MLGLPLLLTVALFAVSFIPRVRDHTTLRWSFWIAGAVLLAGLLLVAANASRRGRPLRFEVVLQRPHYMQAIVQLSIYAYWGWYWPNVYAELPLIVAQLVFAYVFDMLLSWSRRDSALLGFGPFPIILSTNFFIWFRDDWFSLQFLMVAVIFLAKEFVKWSRDGRRTHVFNPAAFALALASLLLILTGSTGITWAEAIVTTLNYPPHIYLFVFLLGLSGMYFFAVTPVAASTAMVLVGLAALYSSMTGVYYFIDSEIPIAVFLGLHLLITDPATSPRTLWGRALFGTLYGISIFGLYGLLFWVEAPTFYDKILAVPLLNLSVRAIDRLVERLATAGWGVPRLGLGPRALNLAFMGVWIAFFFAMRALGAFGETHAGHRVPYWQQACDKGLRGGCRTLLLIESTYCQAGSGWACNEAGAHLADRKTASWRHATAADYFSRACALGFGAGCRNVLLVSASPAGPPAREAPRLADFQLVLQEGKGALPPMTPAELYGAACQQGWPSGCGRMATLYLRGEGVPVDHVRAAGGFQKACAAGEPTSCANLGLMYRRGDGVPVDAARSLALLERACQLGMPVACTWLSRERLK